MARKMNDNSLKNLKKHVFTKEEQQKGQEAARKKREERKNLANIINAWLESPVVYDGEKMSGAEKMVRVAVEQMEQGNPKFWELLRDTAGQKPVEHIVTTEVNSDVVSDIEQMMNDE